MDWSTIAALVGFVFYVWCAFVCGVLLTEHADFGSADEDGCGLVIICALWPVVLLWFLAWRFGKWIDERL
jgi:hypothetical protein